MSLEEKMENLMHLVKDADDKLTGLLIALANEYNTANEKYTREEIESFYQTRDHLLANTERSYTPLQAHDLIRNKRGDEL